MGIVECSPAILESAGKTLDAERPVYMVNMVRYRDHAAYRGKSEFPPCSGREAYFQRYAPAFNNVARGEDYGLFWVGNVRGGVGRRRGGKLGRHRDRPILEFRRASSNPRKLGLRSRSGPAPARCAGGLAVHCDHSAQPAQMRNTQADGGSSQSELSKTDGGLRRRSRDTARHRTA
jgi:hypothetical protein